jgi:hypothetical protein
MCVVYAACSSAAPAFESQDVPNLAGADVADASSRFPDIVPPIPPDSSEVNTGDEDTLEDAEIGADPEAPDGADSSDAIVPDGITPTDVVEKSDGIAPQPDVIEEFDSPSPEPLIPVENFQAVCDLDFLKKEVEFEVAFPENFGVDCPWSQGDNLAPVPAFSSARIDQVQELELPVDSFPCDISVKVLDAQDYQLEDGLIFHLNDIILVSNSLALIEDTPQAPGPLGAEELRRYDWEMVKGKEYVTAGGPPYCLDGEEGGLLGPDPECIMAAPVSEGDFEFESDPAASADLAFDVVATGNALLTATLIGDDDPFLDCQHSGFSATVTVTYVDLSSNNP